jgi:hypothetical protein
MLTILQFPSKRQRKEANQLIQVLVLGKLYDTICKTMQFAKLFFTVEDIRRIEVYYGF